MNVLGINFGHDSSACLIQNGVLKICIEEEKLSRKKSALGYPENAVKYILDNFSLTESQIDVLALGGNSYNLYGRNNIRERLFKKKIDRYRDLMQRILSFLGITSKDVGEQNKDFFIHQIRQKGFKNTEIVFSKHHLAHAASAYYTAPFKADLVITCDGHGDGEAFNFYLPDNNHNLELLTSNDYSTSIGQLYSTVTSYLGFKPNRHEGKIMGLAAFGKDSILCTKMKALFFYEDNKLKRYPNKDFNEKYREGKNLKIITLKKQLSFEGLNTIGKDYALNSVFLFNWLAQNTENINKEDIAFAIQNCTEIVVVNEIKRVIQQQFKNTKVKLALAGGVFANVRLNQLLNELPEVENLFVQPAMSDSGLSLGAAILAERQIHKSDKFHPFKNAFLGVDYTHNIDSFIKEIEQLPNIIISKPDNIIDIITDYLIDDKIIGFYSGIMEWGPRALGHRSIIANPFKKEVNAELNKRLNRTEFMPFAPSILDFKASTYLVDYDDSCPAPHFMTITYNVKKEYHNLLQAVVHIDETCRPHIVEKKENPYYYAILNKFYEKTNCGVLVNTSFNAHEEPIIDTPNNALKTLLDNRIDVLILENYVLILK
jgi:carbamoyltransferase